MSSAKSADAFKSQLPVVMITGASSGIGAALARELAGSARLFLIARRKDRLQELCSELKASGGEAAYVVADLLEVEAIQQVVQACMDQYGNIDRLVLNAGAFSMAATRELEASAIDEMFALNVRAPMLLSAAALKHMKAGSGILAVSSRAARDVFQGCSLYSASKAALEAWGAVLREELREYHIRVGIVAPGATDSEIWGDNALPDDQTKVSSCESVAALMKQMLFADTRINWDYCLATPPGGAL